MSHQSRLPSRSEHRRSAIVAVGLLGALVAGPAAAAPSEDRIVSPCVLPGPTFDALQDLLESAAVGIPAPAGVDFIVVYSLANPNDGQLIGGTSYSGPVLCTRDGIEANSVSQTATIPTVDLLDIETALITQYKPTTEPTEKRFCHSVNENSDCFTIKQTPGEP